MERVKEKGFLHFLLLYQGYGMISSAFTKFTLVYPGKGEYNSEH